MEFLSFELLSLMILINSIFSLSIEESCVKRITYIAKMVLRVFEVYEIEDVLEVART